MTSPKITYGHGDLNECDSTEDWIGGIVGMSDTSLTVLNQDFYKITGTPTLATQDYVYYYRADYTINTTLYPYYVCRWKTSAAASPGLGVGVKVQYGDATGGWIVGHDGSGDPASLDGSTEPQFSSTWKVTVGTLPTGKTIQQIYFQATDWPETLAAGNYSVYFDFLLFCRGAFTFPYMNSVEFTVPNRYVDLVAPTRVGPISQYMGMDLPKIHVDGQIDASTTGWQSNTSYPLADYLYVILLEAYQDPWQWFTSDLVNCKVTPRQLMVRQDGKSKAQRVWSFELGKYEKSGGQPTTTESTVKISRQVAQDIDDCYRYWNGAAWVFDIVNNDQWVGYWAANELMQGGGMRFQNITIPQGATIMEAKFHVYCRTANSNDVVNSKISGDDADNAGVFVDLADYNARFAAHTTAQENWDAITAWSAGVWYTSPDFSSVIQEIVDRPGWTSGNAIALFWEDHDDRSTHVNQTSRYGDAYPRGSTTAPRLDITFASTDTYNPWESMQFYGVEG